MITASVYVTKIAVITTAFELGKGLFHWFRSLCLLVFTCFLSLNIGYQHDHNFFSPILHLWDVSR